MLSILDPKALGSSWRVEGLAGTTTFLTMSYILFVQPVVLGQAGMDRGAVFVATALSSAIATLLMGLLARYPIAQAPAMGHNFFFAFTVVLAMGIPWQSALGAVFLSGCLFLVLTALGFMDRVVASVPDCLKHGIAVGIGLLIMVVGMEWSGLVVQKPGTFIGMGDLGSPPVLVSLFGLLVISVLMVLRVRGSLLIGIALSTILSLILGLVSFKGIAALPPSLSPTFLKMDIPGAFNVGLLEVIFVFFFLDLFDTVGTLIGVAEQAGFMKDGSLPRTKQAIISDAMGTIAGAVLGTSTVTSYIESSAGISEGGRTGTANLFTALLFLVSLFFYPLVGMVGGGVEVEGGITLYPAVAPVLIIVGLFMFKLTSRIEWSDPADAIPAYLAIIVMPLWFSITEGIAIGFISYSLLKTVRGQAGAVPVPVHVIAILFVIRYAFLIF